MKLAFIVAAWLVGVLVGLETRTPLLPLLFLVGGYISIGLALHLRQLPVFPAVLAVILLLGVWPADSVSDSLQPLTSMSLTGQAQAVVSLEGRIANDPEFSGNRVKFELDLSTAALESGLVNRDDRILVFANPPDGLVERRSPPYFDYGDLVTIRGVLRLPEPFDGFDYPAYLASQGISGVMTANSAMVTGGRCWVAEVAVFATWASVKEHRRHDSLPAVCLGPSVAAWAAGRSAPGDGTKLPQHWYIPSPGDLRPARRCIGGNVSGPCRLAIWPAWVLLPGRPADYGLGLRIGLRIATVSGAGSGDGQRISGGGGCWPARQYHLSRSVKRGPDDRSLSGDYPEGVIPTELCRRGRNRAYPAVCASGCHSN